MIQEFIELHGARENNLKNIMPIVVDQKRLGGGSHSTVGTIVYEGSFDGLLRADTITGNHLQHAMRLKDTFRKPIGRLAIKNAKINNLRNLNDHIPRGVLTVVTGVGGPGKSSLTNETLLRQHPDAIVIDQSEIGANRRSTLATYTGIMEEIRKDFAKANNGATYV